MAKDLSYQRMFFIELLAWWKGRITNKDLQSQFKISRQQAHNDLKNYRETAPKNLIQDEPGFVPSSQFVACFINEDPSQFFYWFSSGLLEVQSTHSLYTENLTLPFAQIRVDVIRTLVYAIEAKRKIEANYVSLSHPETDGRIFHPHTLVNTGMRWHVRGYCEKSQGYRDLVLSRFREGTESLTETAYTNEQDLAWQTYITLVFESDPRLSSMQKSVLAHDYQLTQGQLIIETRAALASYVLQQMQIKTKMLDGTPEAQQWILVNQADIQNWLF